jgi:hypothetical protein
MLNDIGLQLVTNVSGWSLSLIFNSQAVQEECQEQADALLYEGCVGGD